MKSLYEFQLDGKSGANSRCYFSCNGVEARGGTSAEDRRSALAGEHLNDPGHLFRSLCLHFIVWSGTQNRFVKESKVFQACACGVCIE